MRFSQSVVFSQNRSGRFSLVLLVLLLFVAPVRAVQYWGEGIFADFGLSATASLPTDTPYEGSLGIRRTFAGAAAGRGAADFFGESTFYGGMCMDDFGLEATVSVQALPLRREFFALGLVYLTHLSRSFVFDVNPDLVTWENLFLLTTHFTGRNRVNPFVITCRAGIGISESFLRLGGSRLTFQEVSPVLEFLFTKRFLVRHEIMFRSATYDLLRFRDFVNLWWQLGYSYDLHRRLTLGVLADVVYTDQVFLSGALSGFQAKLFVVYKL